MIRRILLLSCLCALLLAALVPSIRASSAAATDSDEYEEIEVEEVVEEVVTQQFVVPAPDVQTTVKFLGISDSKFSAGEEVTALISFSNAGAQTFNISYIGAHLHSPYDNSYYIQNFTARSLSAVVPPKSDVTVEYRFRPDTKLETLDYRLSGWIIYNATSSSESTPQIMHRSVFYNSTIDMYEKRQGWNITSILSTLIVLAGLGVAAMFMFGDSTAGKAVSSLGKKVAANASSSASSFTSAATSSKSSSTSSKSSSSNKDDDSSSTPLDSTTGERAPAAPWDAKVYRPSNQQKKKR